MALLLVTVLFYFQVLKMYAWERSYAGKVDTIREPELGLLLKQGIIAATMETMYSTSSFLVRESLTKRIRLTNVGLMLAQRRRRWANINPTLGERSMYRYVLRNDRNNETLKR